uniref:Putative movement protein n=1 Tax=Pelargonium line pattern virus TaxID=167019 RepID=C6F3K2_9TOMB|nr:putative movement protein [Pelargonium line pattern virus]
MDVQPKDTNLSVKEAGKSAKRGSTKNKLDIAHSGVSKGTSRDLVGANFVTAADKVEFVVHLHF